MIIRGSVIQFFVDTEILIKYKGLIFEPASKARLLYCNFKNLRKKSKRQISKRGQIILACLEVCF